ncbi:MAG: glycoside hydrolase family 15 protein [Thermoanaerobaculia bacterium]
MARDLPISNGSLMINFDHDYNIRDVYYPFVGEENQTAGDPSRFGIWSDGRFAWIESPLWNKHCEYEPETLVTRVTATSSSLGIAALIRDTVDFDRDLFIRRVDLRDLRNQPRRVRLFLHLDGHLGENAIGDTVFYDPDQSSLIAYKGQRYILMSGASGDRFGLASFATGVKEQRGFQGTWRDAEDGELSRNPIAQGSVDSTGMIEATLTAGGEATVWFWWAFGRSFPEVTSLASLVRERGPASFMERTEHYWRLWSRKDDSHGLKLLSDPVRDLYRRSLLILRSQVNGNGAVIAATDSDAILFSRDTYSYVWPRDGSIAADAMNGSGYSDVSRKFFEFCFPLYTHDGYLLHKYNPDGSVGSSWHPWMSSDGSRALPIQEDETALVLWALWRHFAKFHDVEFIRPLYRAMVTRSADFLVRFRESHTRLPAPSYDLWEERRGIMSFTTAAVWAGLEAAANFTEAFGETTLTKRYRTAASEIREAAGKFLFDPASDSFVRMVNVSPEGAISIDPVVDSSVCGLWMFGMFAPDDPRIVSTMHRVMDRLAVHTPIGGYARYENDYYYQVTRDTAVAPGNPWIICTLWIARWKAEIARTVEELQQAVDLLDWATDRAMPSGTLPEQVDPFAGSPLSVSPLTWSHAEVILTVHRVIERMRHLGMHALNGVAAAGGE